MPASTLLLIYRFLFSLILQRIEAERAHELAARALRGATAVPAARNLLRRALGPRGEELSVHALGLSFATPLGVAAGLDKDGTWFEGLAALGFGFVEVGTVTARGQDGNPRPRVFRLTRDRALVNRMGFPNPGAEVVAERLRQKEATVVGVNIGKTRVVALDDAAGDYRECARLVSPRADYLVLNISSPNTPGLRDIQVASDRLASLVGEVRQELEAVARRVPLLVKIGPDLTDAELDAIADQAVALGLDGIVAVNTTISARGLEAEPDVLESAGAGGVSGAPLKARALEILERLHARAGERLVLVSVGGVETPEDAWQRILAGATLVQAYTGFIYGGPLWPRRMNRGLARRLRESGRSSLQEAIGAAGARHASHRTGQGETGSEPLPLG